jgi:ABC-type uncharacterized transport system permease subunit
VATAFFFATAAAYAVAAALFSAQLAKTPPKWARHALTALWIGAGLHVAFIGIGASAGVCPVRGIQGALTFFSVGLVVTFLLVSRRYELRAVGAFVTPVTLLMLVSAHFSRASGPLSAGVRGVVLTIHIAANLIGQVAFALAFALSVGYLLQERRLKTKKLLGAFGRMPSLDVLDHLGFRCVTVGFPFLTVGIVLGAIVARRLGEPFHFSPAQVLAILMWLVFAGVVAMRVSAGWRGRRAAIGTILGFLLGVAVLVTYLVRTVPAAGAA